MSVLAVSPGLTKNLLPILQIRLIEEAAVSERDQRFLAAQESPHEEGRGRYSVLIRRIASLSEGR